MSNDSSIQYCELCDVNEAETRCEKCDSGQICDECFYYCDMCGIRTCVCCLITENRGKIENNICTCEYCLDKFNQSKD